MFGSLLVNKDSLTPYSDATQVIGTFLSHVGNLVGISFFFFFLLSKLRSREIR